ncbi:hypothetical protein [Tenacibaculum jejuense]|uniref:hypothetical protein n=1 Tax=Tenacibaculum jejuense TaxID=584609 RepID=UPI0012FE04BF|nr:hypothetical protein [Tenacibaculum jejuense]
MNYPLKKLKFVTPNGNEIEMNMPTADLTLTINRYSNKEFFVDKIQVNVHLN